MRIDTDHLPQPKRRELDRVVQILFATLADETADKPRSPGRVLKIVLYGSHARGGWVDEPYTVKGYQSDFDILIIVDTKALTDRVTYWGRAEEQLTRELSITHSLRTPVNFIVHTLQEVNDGLAHGRYFFMDVARDGIAIYQVDDTDLHTPRPKTPVQALSMAKEYFEEWYPSAAALLEGAEFYSKKGRQKEAAFSLHQATERLYHCILLVTTFYTPHVHNLSFLRSQAERIDRRLIDAWPREDGGDRALFEKIKDAYVKARYSKHFKITSHEVYWLNKRVEELGKIVHDVCIERIAWLEQVVAKQ